MPRNSCARAHKLQVQRRDALGLGAVRYLFNHFSGKVVQSELCSRCVEWTTSTEALREVLNNQWRTCETCAQRSVMWTVSEQYRTGRPRWWVVGGKMIVPIWLVETLKRRR